MAKYSRKITAKEILDLYKDDTAYFDGSLSMENMKEVFRNALHFGEAETNVIIASLILAGAKFTVSNRKDVE